MQRELGSRKIKIGEKEYEINGDEMVLIDDYNLEAENKKQPGLFFWIGRVFNAVTMQERNAKYALEDCEDELSEATRAQLAEVGRVTEKAIEAKVRFNEKYRILREVYTEARELTGWVFALKEALIQKHECLKSLSYLGSEKKQS